MEHQPIKRAALYCRTVNKNSFAIENQLEKLRQFAEENGFDYQAYLDNGYNGLNFERPAFKRMLRAIDTGKINAVIALRLDRFGRNMFETISLLREQIERNKIEVLSIYEGNLTADICNGLSRCEKLARKSKDILSR